MRFDPSKYTDTYDFSFSNKNDYDFFIKGAAPAKPIEIPSSTNRGYYIKVKDGVNIEDVKNNFKNIIWNGFSSVNGGVSWFTKPEIIKLYQEKIEEKRDRNISLNICAA